MKHVTTSKSAGNIDRETLSGESVNDHQQPKRSAIVSSVMDEVIRPNVTWSPGP